LGLIIYINKNLKKSNLFKVANDYVDGFTDDAKHNDKLLRSFYRENTQGTIPPLVYDILIKANSLLGATRLFYLIKAN
jgi:hypothetical protein